MRHCASCDNLWEEAMKYCPFDGAHLEAIEHSAPAAHAGVGEEAARAAAEFDFVNEAIVFAGPENRQSEPGPAGVEISRLVDNALGALDGQRRRDQTALQANIDLYNRFNDYCRGVQQFIEKLREHSSHFRFAIEYEDRPSQMWVCFTLFVGEGPYRRKFPITVRYLRKPRREAVVEVNIYDIGLDRDSRIFRTERISGRARNLGQGYSYLLIAPPEVQNKAALFEWLAASFDNVLQLAYSD